MLLVGGLRGGGYGEGGGVAERGTRWQRSVLTFGPAGRLVATALVLLPALWAGGLGLPGLIAAAMWLLFVVPVALRDVWRRAELPPTELTALRDRAHLEAETRARFESREAPEPITSNRGQRRW